MRYNEYKEICEFESLKELGEYCRAYGDNVPDEFEINIDGELKLFELSVRGIYGYGNHIRVYENYKPCEDGYAFSYIRYEHICDGFYYELRNFLYIDNNSKTYDVFDELDYEVDDKRIDEIAEKIDSVKPFISKIK